MKKLDGIFTALLTPFDENNKINEKSLEKLVKFNLDMGVTGFYVGGTTAEAFMLSTEERMYVACGRLYENGLRGGGVKENE